MFSKKLRDLRKSRGLTQVEFAKTFNIATGTIAMWETGKREPDYETIRKIADYFNVSIDYLLGVDKNEQKKIRSSEDERILKLLQENDDVGKLVEKISQLSPENQQHLLRLVLLEADHIDNQYGK